MHWVSCRNRVSTTIMDRICLAMTMVQGGKNSMATHTSVLRMEQRTKMRMMEKANRMELEQLVDILRMPPGNRFSKRPWMTLSSQWIIQTTRMPVKINHLLTPWWAEELITQVDNSTSNLTQSIGNTKSETLVKVMEHSPSSRGQLSLEIAFW